MLSEEFDKKAKEAADHHHPTYDENAWAKMEKLLDKHLPQKKDDRKRIIFILFLFLLLGGGLYLMIAKPWQHEKPVAATNNIQQNIPVNLTKDAEVENSEKLNPGNSSGSNTIVNEKSIEEKKQTRVTDLYDDNANPIHITRKTEVKKSKIAENTDDPSLIVNDNAIVKTNILKKDHVLKNDDIDRNSTGNNIPPADPVRTIAENNPAEQKLNSNILIGPAQKMPEDATIQAAKKIKTHNRKTNSFALSLSVGPDINFAGLSRPGKTKLLLGAGLSYTFKNKFVLRTGFYSGRKIYSANPYQYHPPAYSWISYYDLKNVDADCKVYEIPVSLSYIFNQSAKQNWFGTVGLSSYLMKKETYNYLYKNSSGQLTNREWTITDENKHYFSVITLSAGYQRNLSNTFSIMAEPYLKIPVSGVGYGKVNLNSAGLLFSVGIKPFATKAKK